MLIERALYLQADNSGSPSMMDFNIIPGMQPDTQQGMQQGPPIHMRVAIYCSGKLQAYDEAQLMRRLAARLGELIQPANIQVKLRKTSKTKPTAVLCSKIMVEVNEEAYLSSVSTDYSSDSGASDFGDYGGNQSHQVNNLEQNAAESGIKATFLRLFKESVTVDKIEIQWVEEVSSYIVMLKTTFVAAELLCHLMGIGDSVLSELAIRAVHYDGRYTGEKSDVEKLQNGLIYCGQTEVAF